MRSVTSQATGDLHSGRTRCPWLEDVHSPVRCASPAAFVGYLNWWLVGCRPACCTLRPDLVFKPAQEHILVHRNLAPRKMVLDGSGKLSVIDWGHAGFYSAYMEYFGIDASWSSIPWFTVPCGIIP